jgi:hypothetical protein
MIFQNRLEEELLMLFAFVLRDGLKPSSARGLYIYNRKSYAEESEARLEA